MTSSWFALGDSFTTGVGDAPEAGGWVGRTAARLTQMGLLDTLENVAVPGVRIEAVHTDQVPLLQGRHTVVSAMAGANNVLHFGLDLTALLGQVAALAHVARRHGEVVLASTCPDFFAHRFGAGTRLSWRVDELNVVVRREAAAAPDQVLVVDTHAILRDRALWDDDGVHPNPAGHEALAAAALPLLEERLDRVAAARGASRAG